MQASEFWKAVTVDESGFLDRLLDLLEREKVRYCVIGGQAVNAHVEPLVSLDLDLAQRRRQAQLEDLLDRVTVTGFDPLGTEESFVAPPKPDELVRSH
jgi:hypothetical protein